MCASSTNSSGLPEQNGSLLCVGLDPDPALMPVRDVAAFNRAIIEATAAFVCAYKPNLAFYEALGEKGYAALRETLAAIPADIPIIADAKRGDIGNTAKAYARALFDELGFDAATVNPYLGGDAVEPFLEREEKAAFVLCRTSNPGARDLQDLDRDATAPRRGLCSRSSRRWRPAGTRAATSVSSSARPIPRSCGACVQLCPEMTFLVPGVGAQGGDLAAVMANGLDATGGGLIINVSRQVLYASKGDGLRGGGRRSGATAPRRDRRGAGSRPLADGR